MEIAGSFFLDAALWLFGIAVAGTLYWQAREFFRSAGDGVPRASRRYMPWWAILSLGFAFLCFEAGFYRQTASFTGVGLLGALVICVGAIAGRRMDWRFRYLFDAFDQDQRANPWPHVERAPPPLADGRNPYPYPVAAETLRRNGLAGLAAGVVFALAAYGVVNWSGSARTFGPLVVLLLPVLVLLAAVTGIGGLITWCRYLLQRAAGERAFGPVDWGAVAVGRSGLGAIAMVVVGVAMMQLEGGLRPLGLIGAPLALVGLWRCLRGLIRRVAERLGS